jgi:hypothetical protein
VPVMSGPFLPFRRRNWDHYYLRHWHCEGWEPASDEEQNVAEVRSTHRDHQIRRWIKRRGVAREGQGSGLREDRYARIAAVACAVHKERIKDSGEGAGTTGRQHRERKQVKR